MGTPKKGKGTSKPVPVMGTDGEEVRTVTIVGAQTVGRMRKGALQILKGGREAARGVFLIAAGTQKVLEVSGGAVLKGADLKEARAVIRTICSGAVDEWHLIEQTVNEAVIDLSALLVRLSAHRAACSADAVVEASLESIRFRSLLEDGHPLDMTVCRMVTSSLGGIKATLPGGKDVPADIVVRQEAFLKNLVDSATDGTEVLTGRAGREYVRSLRNTLGLADTAAQKRVAGRAGKKRALSVMEALQEAGGTFSDMDRKEAGGTDSQIGNALLSTLREGRKIFDSLGPCAARQKIATMTGWDVENYQKSA